MALERSVKKPVKKHDRRNIWLLILTAVLIIGSVALFTPPDQKIHQGLDVRGGLSVVLTAQPEEGQSVTVDDIEESRSIIENRVNALGASEATVQAQGTDQIVVQIPGLADTEEALATVGSTGQLVFARLDSFTDQDVVKRIQEGNFGEDARFEDEFGYSFPAEDEVTLEVEPSTYTTLLTGNNIERTTVDRASQTSAYYAVNLDLDSAGTEAFAEATRDLVMTRGQVVILLDNEVQSAPAVQAIISDGNVQITGNYSSDEALALQAVIESGSLPVNFDISQSQVVGPTLGQEALFAGLIVALIGVALVMLYLLFFYKGLGIITASAVLVMAAIYLGILAGLSYFNLFSLTLSGIAGIVLTIGMAADSSILTVERFREEIRMGRSIKSASISGVRHAIFTSIDADLVSMVSALSLFFLASSSVKGFGLTLALGIICDILMMVLFKAPLIRILAPKVIARHPGFWGIKDCENASHAYSDLAAVEGVSVEEAQTGEQINPAESEKLAELADGQTGESVAARVAKSVKGRFIKKDINFLGYRKIFLTISAVVVVACVAAMGIRGFNLGIEFNGGSAVTYTNTGDITTEQMRDAFAEQGVEDAVIQTTSTNNTDGFLVRTTDTNAESATVVANAVASKLGINAEDVGVDTIGPDWGASVIRSSLIAFFVSIILIIIYIAIRFEFKMGVIAVVALLHDLIIVMGIYALVGREVNPNTIAALLTILGYSLYDTVVTFHRISDNMKGEAIKCSFMTMANHSINQVFIRTINTTLTSFVPVAAMLFFGGETLKDFAFAMAIGLIVGSYSSFAVATPLYSMWKSREKKFAKLQQKYGKTIGIFAFESADSPAIEQVPLARLEQMKKQAKQAQKRAVKLSDSSDGEVGSPSYIDGVAGDAEAAVSAAIDHEKAVLGAKPKNSRNHYNMPPGKNAKPAKKIKRPQKPKK